MFSTFLAFSKPTNSVVADEIGFGKLLAVACAKTKFNQIYLFIYSNQILFIYFCNKKNNNTQNRRLGKCSMTLVIRPANWCVSLPGSDDHVLLLLVLAPGLPAVVLAEV